MGKITLPITFGNLNNPRMEYIVFDIVNQNYPYNTIFGRGTINAFDAVIHQSYLRMKMPAVFGSRRGPANGQASRKRFYFRAIKDTHYRTIHHGADGRHKTIE